MEKLYEIMDKILISEENLNSLIKMLNELDYHLSQEQKDEKFELDVIRKFLEAVTGDIHKSIDALDSFIVAQKSSQK